MNNAIMNVRFKLQQICLNANEIGTADYTLALANFKVSSFGRARATV